MDNKPSDPPISKTAVDLRRIETRSLVFSAILAAASLPFRSWKVTCGVILGAALALLNYFWLKKAVLSILMAKEKKKRSWRVLLYLSKYLITGAAIYLAFKYNLVDIFALIAGLMTVIIAITFEGVIMTRKSAAEEKEKDVS